MTDNAADRKDIRRREKAAKSAEASRAAVIHEVMSTTQGREWVWFVLSECHAFSTTFTGEALTSAFAEGERNAGQRLLNTITEVCPDLFIQAMRESHVRSTTDEQRSSAQPDGRDSGPSDAPDSSGDSGSGESSDRSGTDTNREPEASSNLIDDDTINAARARAENRSQA